MIAIGLIRGISAGVMGSEDQLWNAFWVQIEAAVSVIAACPTAFRSLFLIKTSPIHMPDQEHHNQVHRSILERIWKRNKPSIASINVRATLPGMRTLIRDNGKTQQVDDEYVLSSTEVQSTDSGPSFEAMNRSIQATQETAETRV